MFIAPLHKLSILEKLLPHFSCGLSHTRSPTYMKSPLKGSPLPTTPWFSTQPCPLQGAETALPGRASAASLVRILKVRGEPLPWKLSKVLSSQAGSALCPLRYLWSSAPGESRTVSRAHVTEQQEPGWAPTEPLPGAAPGLQATHSPGFPHNSQHTPAAWNKGYRSSGLRSFHHQSIWVLQKIWSSLFLTILPWLLRWISTLHELLAWSTEWQSWAKGRWHMLLCHRLL